MKRAVVNGLAHMMPETEVRLCGGRRRADIVVDLYNYSTRVVIECQHSKMPIKEFASRQRDYGRAGHLLWIFEASMVGQSPIEVGYERIIKGSGEICKAVHHVVSEQGFVHVMDGTTVQVLAMETVTRSFWAWDGTPKHRQYLRVSGVHVLTPPFTIVLRDGRFPRLAEHYE